MQIENICYHMAIICMFISMNIQDPSLLYLILSAFVGMLSPYVYIGLISSYGADLNWNILCKMINDIEYMTSRVMLLCIMVMGYKYYNGLN